MDFFRKLFRGGETPSATTAKERLKLVIMHDRSDISPQLLENLRVEIIAALKKYMEIDEAKIEIDVDQNSHSMSLVASIPVVRVRQQNSNMGEKSVVEERALPPMRNPGFKNKRHR